MTEYKIIYNKYFDILILSSEKRKKCRTKNTLIIFTLYPYKMQDILLILK